MTRLAWLGFFARFGFIARLGLFTRSRPVRDGRFVLSIEQRFELALAVRASQPDTCIKFLAIAAVRDWHPPAARERSQDVLESVGRTNVATGEANDLIAVAQAATVGIAVVEDVVYDNAALGIGRNRGTQRSVVHDSA